MDMLIKLAPASVATALASIVFPVPGGPKSNIPLHGWNRQMQVLFKVVVEPFPYLR